MINSTLSKEKIEELGEELESKTPGEIISFAVETFGSGIALASSFGPEDVALIDFISKTSQPVKIFCLDTGYLFKETHELIEKVQSRYGVSVDICSADTSIAQMEGEFGKDVFKSDPGTCCQIRKIEPLKKALSTLDAWITGIRRDQTPMRANAKKIEYDSMFSLVKFNPLADWSSDQVWEYIKAHDVPYNPLHDQNYLSIGCEPCTKSVPPGEDPRAGRWQGNEKTECGLHFDNDGKVIKPA